MIDKFIQHYHNKQPEIRYKLIEFSKLNNANDDILFEEMAFCTFAANSSAKMGLLAVKLLKPVLKKGDLQEYKEAVHKKVRFYSKRAEYLHHNKKRIEELGGLRKNLKKIKNYEKTRLFIRDNFKGFGL